MSVFLAQIKNKNKMITREEFTQFIKSLKDLSDRSDKVYQAGIDLLEYENNFQEIISFLSEKFFGEGTWDWITYYVYEEGRDVWDEKGNKVPFNTVDDLFDYLAVNGYLKSVQRT